MILDHNKRPFVVFDASLQEHRRAAAKFKKTKSWSKIKYRFDINDDSSNVVDMVDKKLIWWYLDQEFNKSAKSRKSKSRPKINKFTMSPTKLQATK